MVNRQIFWKSEIKKDNLDNRSHGECEASVLAGDLIKEEKKYFFLLYKCVD